MNIWVEFYKYSDDRKNTHAQMKRESKWVSPDPSIIRKRFFDKMRFKVFAKRMEEDGNMVSIREMGVCYEIHTRKTYDGNETNRETFIE